MLSQNCIKTKDVKSYCYDRCATLQIRVGEIGLGPKQAQLFTLHSKDFQTLSCNQRVVVCYIVWLGSVIYGMFFLTSARCMDWSLVLKLTKQKSIEQYFKMDKLTGYDYKVVTFLKVIKLESLKSRGQL